MQSEIKNLLQIIENQLGWGTSATWKSRDFEMLNQLIFDKTKVSLSASTLRRIWGRVEYNHLPSITTLDALAGFAGFENWRVFLKKNAPVEVPRNKRQAPVGSTRISFKSYVLVIVALLEITTASFFSFYWVNRNEKQIDPNNFSFSSERLATGIPNSVVFNYDASLSPVDSIYIQQSWDPRTKTRVSKGRHEFTSVYYEPGFYLAKLLIGDRIVQQHKLMIPTSGWLGLIENKPVPFYLNPSDFIFKDGMRYKITPSFVKNEGIPLQVPDIKYFNVGNFTPVSLKGFSFSVLVKNEYRAGSAACQYALVSLITDSGPIIIPLSVKGCVSELNMVSVDWVIPGKINNLSGFGVDFSDWVLVSCKNSGNKIQYYINNKLAYQSPMPTYNVKIVGVGFGFQGTGAVKNIELKSADNMAYSAF